MARRFQLRFACCFALFCVYYVLTNFALSRKGPTVNYSKSLFLLIFWQSSPSIVNVTCSLSRQFCLAIVAAGCTSCGSRGRAYEYSCQNLLAAVKWKPRGQKILRTADALPNKKIAQIAKENFCSKCSSTQIVARQDDLRRRVVRETRRRAKAPSRATGLSLGP